MLKAGDRVRAIQDTRAAFWAEGRIGTIAELRDPVSYSGNDSNNLIRWDGDVILIGFDPYEVELLNTAN